jgi:cytochrome P450
MSAESSLGDVLSPSFFANPYPMLQRMRAEAPVYWHPQLQAVCLTRHADVQLLAKDPRFTVERVSDQFGRGVGDAIAEERDYVNRFMVHWMVFADPPRHTRIRSLVARGFTPQVVEQLRTEARRITKRCIDAALPHGKMDIVHDLGYVLPVEIIAGMLGVPLDRTAAFKGWTLDLMNFLGAGPDNEEPTRRAYRGVLGLEGLFSELIGERRKTPTTDILSALVSAEIDGTRLSDEEIISTSTLILLAGFETTTNLLGNSVLALLEHPEQLAKLRADLSLLPNAVEELHRYDAAILQIARRAKEDIDLGDHVIRAGQLVFGFLLAANRDAAVYTNPDTLDITRPDLRHLGFGFGIHTCLGIAIARMELQVALEAVVTRLPNLALTNTPIERTPSFVVHGCVSLPVVFDPIG